MGDIPIDEARARLNERLGKTESGRDPKLDAPGDVEPAPAPPVEVSDDHAPPLDDLEDAKHLAEDDPRRQEVERWAQQPNKGD